MKHRLFDLLPWAVAACLLAGCGGGEAPAPPGAEAPPAEPSGDALDLAPAHGPTTTLPPDHPPLTPEGSIPPPPPPGAPGTSSLTWSVPEGWIEETPSSTMRRAQYRIPGPAGPGECVVFYFGPGQGGDPMSNAVRWAGQFEQPDGRPSTEVMETRRTTVGDLEVLLVEVTGTYSNLMVRDEELPEAMLLGAVVQAPDANWFIKLTGPEETVRTQRDAFRSFIESVKLARTG